MPRNPYPPEIPNDPERRDIDLEMELAVMQGEYGSVEQFAQLDPEGYMRVMWQAMGIQEPEATNTLPRRTAAKELSELIFDSEQETLKRVPFKIGDSWHAAEFIRNGLGLTAIWWSYHKSFHREDSPEVLEGGIKFTNNDGIRVKYDALDNYGDRLFAEGLVPDRECEPQDLVRWQPVIEAAIEAARHD